MKASVIIPAFNAKKCVGDAIRSITATPPSFDYEILVVDDGSTDGTGAYLEELKKEIPALRVLSQENAGPAVARNLGIREARGEYILFADSDDTFEPGAIDEAVGLCKKAGVQILIFGYRVVQGEEASDYSYPDTLLTSPEDWKTHLAPLYSANMLNQVWGKVFSAALLKENQILFPAQLWGEDRLFFFSALATSSRVAVSSRPLYRYIQQKNSLISRFVPEKCAVCQKIHESILSLARKWGDVDEESGKIYRYMYQKSLISALSNLSSPSCSLSYRQKKRYVVEEILPRVALDPGPVPAESGMAFRILFALLQGGNVTLILLSAWGMKAVSHLLPALFRRAKHVYNKGEEK